MVLNVLHFSWSAIFFYIYTSRITFAKVKSQGAAATADGPSSIEPDPSQHPEAVRPSRLETITAEACSPKSVYALASKVGSLFLRC